MCTLIPLGMHVFSDYALRDFTAYTNLYLRQRMHRNVRSRRSHTAAHRNTTSYCAWFVNIKMRHCCRKSLNRSLRSVVYPCPGMARHFFQENDVRLQTDAKQGPLLPVRWYTLHDHNSPNNIQYKTKRRPRSSAEAFRQPSRRQRRGQRNTWWSDPHSWFMTVPKSVFPKWFLYPTPPSNISMCYWPLIT